MAVIGVVVKLFIIRAPRWVTAGVYLVMGWFSVVGVQEIITQMPPGAIFWLVAGGSVLYHRCSCLYDKEIEFNPGVFGFHEIWHIFVILGALSHFMIMLIYINP